MSRTIINVLEELGLAVDLSLLKETRGIHIYGKTVFFGHDHLDVSAAVFYKCSLVSDTLVDALLIDCSYEISIPKDLGILCGKAHPKISFSGVDFLGANLQDVNLYGANLQGANFHNTHLQGVVLRHAKLQGANLRFANLYRADLRGADLTGADFEGADLSGANLKDAKVDGVRGLHTAIFSRTIVSPSIKMFLPEGLA